MTSVIPYGKQHITDDDVEAVIKVLRSDFLTQGPVVPAFEKVIQKYCNIKHAIAVNSATSAIHISLLALRVSNNDYVWTSPITFVASANAALYCGAKVDFVDVDPLTYNLCPKALEAKLEQASKDGTLPKVVIPVHLAGQSCDMKAIYELSLKFNFYIVEDASHAIGGQYQGKAIGSCNYSDISVFSFHPVKIITTAEGGVAVTKSKKLASRLSLFRSHGITRDQNLMTCQNEGAWYYEQIELGYNYRMTDIQAALGISQMQRLDDYVKRRHEIANYYNFYLKDLPLICPYQDLSCFSSFHLYIVRIDLDKVTPLTHRVIFDLLRNEGILVNLHYIPVYLQPYYQKMGFQKGDFPNSEKYYSTALSLPIYPTMSQNQQDQVVNIIKKLIKK